MWVEQLAATLGQHGIHAILDRWDLQPGDSLTRFMETGIASMTCGLFIATPESKRRADAESHYLGYEKRQLAHGLVAGVRVIPVVRRAPEGIEQTLPRFLHGILAIDFRDDEAFYANVERLAMAIKGESPRPRAA
jgi:hypothetical protein